MQAELSTLLATVNLPPLTLRLSPRDRRLILWSSLLPATVVSALLVNVSLSFALEDTFFPGPSPLDPEGWRRLSKVAETVRGLGSLLALPILIGTGMLPWSRQAGSWMFTIGAALAGVAMGLTAVTVLIFAAASREDTEMWRPYTWSLVAGTLAPLAAGYLFVAWRCATSSPSGQPGG